MVHQGFNVADALRRRCPISTGHEPKLIEAFSRTKASLVLTVCEKGAPSSTSMILDRWMHLAYQNLSVSMLCEVGVPNSTSHELMLVQASACTKASLVLMV